MKESNNCSILLSVTNNNGATENHIAMNVQLARSPDDPTRASSDSARSTDETTTKKEKATPLSKSSSEETRHRHSDDQQKVCYGDE
jgi:hypothetical protein